jgi:hypothetical protein
MLTITEDYSEYGECESFQVSCYKDYKRDVSDPQFFRSVSFFGCKRKLPISPNPAADQADMDKFRGGIIKGYMLCMFTALAQGMWSLVEQALYVYI